MAQNITLLGASYSDVPAVELPKTGGGTASFTDVTDTTAAAADVASGKYFYTAAGVRTAGTGSGGGGGAEVTKITEIIPVDYSISFSSSAMPCMIVIEDETRSYQISSVGAVYSVMYSYYRVQGSWYYTRAYGTRNPKYEVRDVDEGLTNNVSYSNGIVTISDFHLRSNTTYTVEYAIEASGGGTISSLSVSANGTYTASGGVDGYSPVTVNVPNSYAAADEGKVVSNGALVSQTSDTKTANGTYDTTTISSVTVNVPTVKYGVIRTDAELLQSYSYDKLLVQDGVATWPAYSTSSKTLLSSGALTPTITMSYEDYHYYVLERMYIYPIYNTNTKAAGREEYHFTAATYEVAQVQEDVFQAMDGTPYSNRVFTITGNAVSRLIYWTSGTAMAGYSSTAQGLMINLTAPTAASGVLTINRPSITVKGNATYLSSTYFGAVTDARAQYKIEVYRVPNDTPLIGWGCTQQMMSMASDIASNSHTLI